MSGAGRAARLKETRMFARADGVYRNPEDGGGHRIGNVWHAAAGIDLDAPAPGIGPSAVTV